MVPLRTRLDSALTRWFATSTLSYRQVGALVGPLVLSQAWIVGQGVLNPVLVAPVGQSAINAVSTVEYLNMLCASVLMAVAAAGSVLAAQHVGASSLRSGGADHGEGVRRAAVGTVWTATLVGLAIAVPLALAHGAVLDVLLGPLGRDAVALGRVYLLAAALSYPAFGAVEGAAAVLRGTARTRAALNITLVMHGGYVVLALLLVLGAGQGVAGLAWAIVASRWVAVVFALAQLRRHGLVGGGASAWLPRLDLLSRIAVLSVPFVIEMAFFNGGKLLAQWFVVGMGPGHVTVNAIMVSLTMFAEIVAFSMSLALVPLVGQAVGAGRFDEARRLVRSFVLASVAVLVVTCLLMLAVFDPLLDLYRTPDDLRGTVTLVFLITLVGRIIGAWSLSFLVPAALRAAGDASFATLVTSVSMVLRVLGIWVFGVVLGGGVVAVWTVMVAEWTLRGIVFGWRFRSGEWERKRWVDAAG